MKIYAEYLIISKKEIEIHFECAQCDEVVLLLEKEALKSSK